MVFACASLQTHCSTEEELLSDPQQSQTNANSSALSNVCINDLFEKNNAAGFYWVLGFIVGFWTSIARCCQINIERENLTEQ